MPISSNQGLDGLQSQQIVSGKRISFYTKTSGKVPDRKQDTISPKIIKDTWQKATYGYI